MSHTSFLAMGPFLACLVLNTALAQTDHPAPPAVPRTVTPVFVPNVGQWDHDAAFVVQFADSTAFIERRGLVLAQENGHEGVAIRLMFDGVDEVSPDGEVPLASQHSFFRGCDHERWRAGVRPFGRVRWSRPWPGIDVVAYVKDDHLEYDLELRAGADLDRVRITVDGADGLRVADDGALIIETPVGPLRQSPPVSWIEGEGGERVPVTVRYELDGDDRFRFATSQWPGDTSLTIDPGLVYGTYLGGGSREYVHSVHRDPATGVLTVAGWTETPGFPTTMGVYQPTIGGQRDLFVARLDPSLPAAQQILAATFLGGSARDSVGIFNERPMAVVPGVGIAVGGYSESVNYPVTANAWSSARSSARDAVVSVLDPSLTMLLYSSYLGGNGDDDLHAIHFAPSLRLTLAGHTASSDFVAGNPTNGTDDGFVVQLDPGQPPAQQLVPLVRIRGNGQDRVVDLSLDSSGRIGFCGVSTSTDLATTANAWQPVEAGSCFNNYWCSAFFGVVDPMLPQPLVYLSYFDGPGVDRILALDLADTGVVTLCGESGFGAAPTTQTFGSISGFTEALIARIDLNQAPANQLIYHARFGGDGSESVNDFVLDAAGRIVIVGTTNSANGFPTTAGAFSTTLSGNDDAFLAWVDPAQPGPQQLLYSTLYGGPSFELGMGVALDGITATIVGQTFASVPTTPGAWDETPAGSTFMTADGFIAQIEMAPLPPPTLTSISPGVVPNYNAPTVSLTGSGLLFASEVLLDGVPVSGFTVVSDTQIDFTVPAATAIANGRLVTVIAHGNTSNAVLLDVTGVHPAALVMPGAAVRGFASTMVIHGDVGWLAALAVSLTNTPSVAPGIVSLGLGSNFTQVINAGITTLDGTGTGTIPITFPMTVPVPLRVYGQVITFDPNNVVAPLETSNVDFVDVVF